MEHNVDFGPEAQANHCLAVLRGLDFEGEVAADARFSPGVFLSTDPESEPTAHVTSRPGQLLDLELASRRPWRWMSLNLELGEMDLTGRNVLGVMLKSRAAETLTFRVCLRSGTDEGFQDAFFGKRVIAYGEESTHADLLKLDNRNDVPATASWRELLLFFPPETTQLSLRDLALFGV